MNTEEIMDLLKKISNYYRLYKGKCFFACAQCGAVTVIKSGGACPRCGSRKPIKITVGD